MPWYFGDQFEQLHRKHLVHPIHEAARTLQQMKYFPIGFMVLWITIYGHKLPQTQT